MKDQFPASETNNGKKPQTAPTRSQVPGQNSDSTY